MVEEVDEELRSSLLSCLPDVYWFVTLLDVACRNGATDLWFERPGWFHARVPDQASVEHMYEDVSRLSSRVEFGGSITYTPSEPVNPRGASTAHAPARAAHHFFDQWSKENVLTTAFACLTGWFVGYRVSWLRSM